jgi:hypothetical protein
MPMCTRSLSWRPGSSSSLPLGAPEPDEHGVEFPRIEQLPHAPDRRVQLQVRAHVDDVADLLVEHLGGQPERRDVGAHQTARHRELLEYRDLVAQRQQVVRDGERCGTRADAGDALAVLLARRLGQQRR